MGYFVQVFHPQKLNLYMKVDTNTNSRVSQTVAHLRHILPFRRRTSHNGDYIYIFYNTSPEYPTKVKLEKEELQSLRDLSHPKAEKDAENKESTLFEPLKFKLGACGGSGGIRTHERVTPLPHFECGPL